MVLASVQMGWPPNIIPRCFFAKDDNGSSERSQLWMETNSESFPVGLRKIDGPLGDS